MVWRRQYEFRHSQGLNYCILLHFYIRFTLLVTLFFELEDFLFPIPRILFFPLQISSKSGKNSIKIRGIYYLGILLIDSNRQRRFLSIIDNSRVIVSYR